MKKEWRLKGRKKEVTSYFISPLVLKLSTIAESLDAD
jgi:hypothetical protein